MKTAFQTPIKIWYRSHPSLPKIIWPIVNITLKYKGISPAQPFLALIDSGSSISVLHLIVAQMLGGSI